MENKIIYQKLSKSLEDQYALAQKYFGILSVLNGLKLTEREIQLVAYTAVRGNISSGNVRDDFCKQYKSSGATIDNIVSKTKRLGIMEKKDGKIRVIPAVALNFEKDLILQIHLRNGK
jgi:hypothetical protein